MRSRTNANVYRRAAAPSSAAYNADNGGGSVALGLGVDDDDYNGKDKVKMRSKFKLPPPPVLKSLSTSANASTVNMIEQQNTRSGNGIDAEVQSAFASQSIAAAPQQPQLQQHKYNVNQTSFSNPYHNSYQPNFSHISQPYKPNNCYINTRNHQRKRLRMRVMLVAISSAIALLLFYFGIKHIQFHELNNRNNHQHRRHHSDHHHHIHSMTGFMESPIAFAKEHNPQIDHSKPILPKETTYHGNQQKKHSSSIPEGIPFVPVTTLSNGRLLPLIGFGVASQSVDHKEIPSIVATLLQYASAESEGGGGIAMIDAVIDEKREVENNGGRSMFSGNIHKFDENEEMVESSQAKTAISLVGRAISFFGKENMSRHSDKGLLRNAAKSEEQQPEDEQHKYDYENRLEVHLLIGIADADLGREKTVAALKDIFSELDELVPPFPNDLDVDEAQVETKLSAVYHIDRHVDLRLHVLVRSPHCHDESDLVVPCTSSPSPSTNDKVEKWAESYNVLEKLYDKKLIQGIGFDGVYVEDVREFLKHCRIQPQIYRGDVYQALEGYGRRMGVGNHISDGKELQQVLKDHNITFLASNVAGHVLSNKHLRPNAYGLLQHLGSVLYHAHREYTSQNGADNTFRINHKGGEYYTVPRLILAYLVRHNVGVLPHAYKAEHLADDAPESVSSLSSFLSKRRLAEIGVALKAMVSDRDLPEDHGLGMEGERETAAVFHNEIGQDALLFRVLDHVGGGKEVAIPPERGGNIQNSHSSVIISNPGDKFAVYGAESTEKIGDYVIPTNAEAGGATDFIINS